MPERVAVFGWMSHQEIGAELGSVRDLNILPQSLVVSEGTAFGVARTDAGLRLAILAEEFDPRLRDSFEGESIHHAGKTLLLGPTSPRNAAALRERLPWLQPRPLGLRTSVGLGDRLGLATPGHVRAIRAVGGDLAPIFAQQSIREMTRTGRTPQQVMDDATWGIFAEGWRDGVGADADHLKTTTDIDACVAAGYTFFTIDPSEHVDNTAETASLSTVRVAIEKLPWEQLEDNAKGLRNRYLDQSFDVEGHRVSFDEQALLRAAVKYGRSLVHVATMYRHLIEVTGGKNCELEISVDENDAPTTHAEHIYIVKELRRLGVQWVSLAPRYVGRFEKGVDYIGDVDAPSREGVLHESGSRMSSDDASVAAFEANFAIHAAIARCFGPYKLSLHSGSDKFSIYPAVVRQARGLVHLKTAGTSYLEALRTIATIDPAFFRSIYAFARERYETDRAGYHVSARLDRAPLPNAVPDAGVPSLLNQFDAREILHVTFGSVLTARAAGGGWRFYDRLIALLRAHSEAYATNLEGHFRRHLASFVAR